MPGFRPSAAHSLDSLDERRSDSVSFLITAGAMSLFFAVATAMQTVFVFSFWMPVGGAQGLLWQRIVANTAGLAVVVAILTLVMLTRIGPTLHEWWRVRTVVLVLAASVVGGVARVSLQQVLGISSGTNMWNTALEFSITITGAATAAVFGFVVSSARRQARDQVREAYRQRQTADVAVRALQSEELRVKKELAEGLHGTLQQHLVILSAELRELIAETERLESASSPLSVRLQHFGAALARVREQDVRQLSRMLYPPLLEVGVVSSIRALLQRLPPSIVTTVTVSPAFRLADDPEHNQVPLTQRAIIVRVAEEAVTNALTHGAASSIVLQLELSTGNGAPRVVLVVRDNGSAQNRVGWAESGASATDGAGLSMLRSRVGAFGGTLTLAVAPVVGATLRLDMPLAPQVREVELREDPLPVS